MPVLERFVQRRVSRLKPHEVGRNSWGTLWFRWPSASAAIESLYLSVTPYEVVLSCKSAHKHFDNVRYRDRKLSNLQLKKRISRDAVNEASLLLRGEVAIITESTTTAIPGSALWCRASQVPESLSKLRELYGAEMRYKVWFWSGEAPN